jgi:aspartokinase-like uncharacterized kinase
MSASAPVTVYKLGGSLLSLSDLGARTSRLFASRRESRPLLIIGGGDAADLVRRWDRAHHLAAETAHDLALAAMSLNESLVEKLLPGARIVADRQQAARSWGDNTLPILCARRFLSDEEAICDDPLPRTWEVTSDSIAAWVAIRWPAARLVLLKSTSDIHRDGLVDAHFKYLLPKLSDVSVLNLRADDSIAQPLTVCAETHS